MPFGVKSHRDLDADAKALQDLGVTNAFRREVPSGPNPMKTPLQSHIAASPMPFGVKSHRDEIPKRQRHLDRVRSPMPFGVKSHRDPPHHADHEPQPHRHQCLSA